MSLRQTFNDLAGVVTFGDARRELWNTYQMLGRVGASPGLRQQVINIRNQISGYIWGGVDRQGNPDPSADVGMVPDGMFPAGAALPADFKAELVNLADWLREEGLTRAGDKMDPSKKRDAVDMAAGVSKRIQKATIGSAVGIIAPVLPWLVAGAALYFFGPAIAASIRR